MSGLETAIRNALEKAERGNPEVRARIYQSARQALEGGLRKQDVTDPATVAAQRHRLETTIKMIEQEERAHLGVATVDPAIDLAKSGLDARFDDVDGDRRDAERASRGDDDFGTLRAERLSDGPRAESASEPLAAPEGKGRAGRGAADAASLTGTAGKRRSSYARLFVAVILLTFLAMAAWWANTSDVFLTDAERDTSVANPPPAVSEEDVAPEGDRTPSLDSASNFSRDWVEIVKPGDIDRVVAGTLAKAEVIDTGEGPGVRVVSSSRKPEAAVRILLPQESLPRAAGQAATIAISLKSASEETVQITIDCDFGGKGGCERHRFTVTPQRSDALLQVAPGVFSTGGEAALVLNSDMDGKGRGVDLLAVRLLAVP